MEPLLAEKGRLQHEAQRDLEIGKYKPLVQICTQGEPLKPVDSLGIIAKKESRCNRKAVTPLSDSRLKDNPNKSTFYQSAKAKMS